MQLRDMEASFNKGGNMQFEEAMKLMREGKTVKVDSAGASFRIVEGELSVVFQGRPHPTMLSSKLIMSEKWEIVE